MTEETNTPCGLIVEQMGSLTGSAKSVVLFGRHEDAVAAHDGLVEAVKAYNNRSNNREKYYTMNGLIGPATFDVSSISGVGVDRADHPAQLAWAKAIGILRRAGDDR